MAWLVNNLPAMQETRVQSLVWEDPLEKEVATHSSILAWKIQWTEEHGRLQSMGSDTTEQLHFSQVEFILDVQSWLSIQKSINGRFPWWSRG